MSNLEILNNGKIYGQYLPQAPAPHPYVENPMASDLDAAGFNINNVEEVAFDIHSSVTASATELKLVNSNPAGCIVQVTDGTNSGQVYDTHFNPLPANDIGTILTSWTTTLDSATQALGSGVGVPSDGWYAMAIDVDITGATITQNPANGYKIGFRYDNAGFQATVVSSSSQVIDASEMLPTGGWNEFKFTGYVYLTKMATLGGNSVEASYSLSSFAQGVTGGTVKVTLIRATP